MARPLNLSTEPPREAHLIAFNKYSKIIDIRSMPRGWLRRKISNIQIWKATATDSNRNASLGRPQPLLIIIEAGIGLNSRTSWNLFEWLLLLGLLLSSYISNSNALTNGMPWVGLFTCIYH